MFFRVRHLLLSAPSVAKVDRKSDQPDHEFEKLNRNF